MSVPKLTLEGHRIAILGMGEHTAENLPSVTTLLKTTSILFDIALKKDQHKGYIIIMDASNLTTMSIPLMLSFMKAYGTRFVVGILTNF